VSLQLSFSGLGILITEETDYLDFNVNTLPTRNKPIKFTGPTASDLISLPKCSGIVRFD
jgi:hypothetical protein